MKSEIDKKTAEIIGSLLDASADEVISLVTNAKLTSCEEIIPIKAILKHFGFSYSSLRRRMSEIRINFENLRGHKGKKGLPLSAVKKLQNHNFGQEGADHE